MTSFPTLRGAVCVAALFAAGTAQADVTAEQVWADWQANMSTYGDETIATGSEVREGDTLTISNIVLTMNDEFSTVTATMGDLILTELGDGTVAIQPPASYPIRIVGEEDINMTMTVNQSGLEMIASGTPDALNYAITADQYGIGISDIIENGEKLNGNFRLIANDVSGTYTSRPGDVREVDYNLVAASIDVLADMAATELPGDYFTLSGRVEGFSATATVAMPDGEDVTPEAIFARGFGFNGGYAYTSSAYLFDVKAEGEQTSGTARTGAGTLSADLSADRVSYDSNITDMNVAVQGTEVPFPIEVAMAEYGFGIDMPLAPSDEASDFGLRLNMTDLAVNDAIWMMADPSGALPHDPTTLLIDLSGQARLLLDLMNTEQAMEMGEVGMPAELTALTLNDLSLKIGGAELAAKGDFTFDNTDLATFDGFPRPTGKVTANLRGANALIDDLVEIGIVSADQAMMGRMMMGMFATPVGDDELTSTLEVKGSGSVIANGQQIR